MNLVEGQLLELKNDLNCGLRIIKAGTIFEVVSVGYNVAVKVNGLGAGIFTKEEIEEYFAEHNEEDEFSSLADVDMNSEIQKVVQDSVKGITIVTLKSGAVGIATCKEDEFDYQKGLEAAYVKAKILELTAKLEEY